MNRWNPDCELLDRPIPDGMIVDVLGLVEASAAEAEDWITAWLGPSASVGMMVKESPSIPGRMTEREAFEGIECLGRLVRSRPELLSAADGQAVLHSLADILSNNSNEIAELALSFPDIEAWLQQAKAIDEEADTDSEQATAQLLLDLDALDFLAWFIERYTPHLTNAESYLQFDKRLIQCHLWLGRHTELFIQNEALIRATAKSISPNLDETDPTGQLSLSTVKYIQLLDQCEAARDDAETLPSVDFILQQPRYGGLKYDYLLPTAASVAGATPEFAAAKTPITWHDPLGKFEATVFLPDSVIPGRETLLEISLGTGEGFSDPAIELIGQSIQLGGASSIIESRDQGGELFVFATITLQSITSMDQLDVELLVHGERWTA